MTAEEWLERNTFYCRKLQARLNPDQCRLNKAEALRIKPVAGPMFHCLDCLHEPSIERGVAMSSKSRVKTCLECKEAKRIIGRGLCSKCYWAAKNAGTLENYEMKVPRFGARPELAANVSACLEPVVTDADQDFTAPSRAELEEITSDLLPGEIVYAPAPPVGIDRFLARPEASIALDLDLVKQIQAQKISSADINQLLRYLLNGELERHPHRSLGVV